jgi:hypothetical protein
MKTTVVWNGLEFELSGGLVKGGYGVISDDPYFFDADDDEVTAFQIKHNGADITDIVDDYVYNSLYELFMQEARSAL